MKQAKWKGNGETEMKQSKELGVAIKAAKEAGKILMKNFGTGFTARKKSADEFVTEVDFASERRIISLLAEAFPDYPVLAEESGFSGKKGSCRWIVDPLDGTHNFFFGIPVFGVSIAFEKDGIIQCGVLALPFVGELYSAEKGKGAFLNGNPIKVSERTLNEARVNLCAGMWKRVNNFEKVKELTQNISSASVLGSSVFALVKLASGAIDATVEFNDKLWDFAAGWLLVEEAGGRLTAFDGSRMSFEKTRYIASNGVFHKQLAEIMGAIE